MPVSAGMATTPTPRTEIHNFSEHEYRNSIRDRAIKEYLDDSEFGEPGTTGKSYHVKLKPDVDSNPFDIYSAEEGLLTADEEKELEDDAISSYELKHASDADVAAHKKEMDAYDVAASRYIDNTGKTVDSDGYGDFIIRTLGIPEEGTKGSGKIPGFIQYLSGCREAVDPNGDRCSGRVAAYRWAMFINTHADGYRTRNKLPVGLPAVSPDMVGDLTGHLASLRKMKRRLKEVESMISARSMILDTMLKSLYNSDPALAGSEFLISLEGGNRSGEVIQGAILALDPLIRDVRSAADRTGRKDLELILQKLEQGQEGLRMFREAGGMREVSDISGYISGIADAISYLAGIDSAGRIPTRAEFEKGVNDQKSESARIGGMISDLDTEEKTLADLHKDLAEQTNDTDARRQVMEEARMKRDIKARADRLKTDVEGHGWCLTTQIFRCNLGPGLTDLVKGMFRSVMTLFSNPLNACVAMGSVVDGAMSRMIGKLTELGTTYRIDPRMASDEWNYRHAGTWRAALYGKGCKKVITGGASCVTQVMASVDDLKSMSYQDLEKALDRLTALEGGGVRIGGKKIYGIEAGSGHIIEMGLKDLRLAALGRDETCRGKYSGYQIDDGKGGREVLKIQDIKDEVRAYAAVFEDMRSTTMSRVKYDWKERRADYAMRQREAEIAEKNDALLWKKSYDPEGDLGASRAQQVGAMIGIYNRNGTLNLKNILEKPGDIPGYRREILLASKNLQDVRADLEVVNDEGRKKLDDLEGEYNEKRKELEARGADVKTDPTLVAMTVQMTQLRKQLDSVEEELLELDEDLHELSNLERIITMLKMVKESYAGKNSSRRDELPEVIANMERDRNVRRAIGRFDLDIDKGENVENDCGGSYDSESVLAGYELEIKTLASKADPVSALWRSLAEFSKGSYLLLDNSLESVSLGFNAALRNSLGEGGEVTPETWGVQKAYGESTVLELSKKSGRIDNYYNKSRIEWVTGYRTVSGFLQDDDFNMGMNDPESILFGYIMADDEKWINSMDFLEKCIENTLKSKGLVDDKFEFTDRFNTLDDEEKRIGRLLVGTWGLLAGRSSVNVFRHGVDADRILMNDGHIDWSMLDETLILALDVYNSEELRSGVDFSKIVERWDKKKDGARTMDGLMMIRSLMRGSTTGRDKLYRLEDAATDLVSSFAGYRTYALQDALGTLSGILDGQTYLDSEYQALCADVFRYLAKVSVGYKVSEDNSEDIKVMVDDEGRKYVELIARSGDAKPQRIYCDASVGDERMFSGIISKIGKIIEGLDGNPTVGTTRDRAELRAAFKTLTHSLRDKDVFARERDIVDEQKKNPVLHWIMGRQRVLSGRSLNDGCDGDRLPSFQGGRGAKEMYNAFYTAASTMDEMMEDLFCVEYEEAVSGGEIEKKRKLIYPWVYPETDPDHTVADRFVSLSKDDAALKNLAESIWVEYAGRGISELRSDPSYDKWILGTASALKRIFSSATSDSGGTVVYNPGYGIIQLVGKEFEHAVSTHTTVRLPGGGDMELPNLVMLSDTSSHYKVMDALSSGVPGHLAFIPNLVSILAGPRIGRIISRMPNDDYMPTLNAFNAALGPKGTYGKKGGYLDRTLRCESDVSDQDALSEAHSGDVIRLADNISEMVFTSLCFATRDLQQVSYEENMQNAELYDLIKNYIEDTGITILNEGEYIGYNESEGLMGGIFGLNSERQYRPYSDDHMHRRMCYGVDMIAQSVFERMVAGNSETNFDLDDEATHMDILQLVLGSANINGRLESNMTLLLRGLKDYAHDNPGDITGMIAYIEVIRNQISQVRENIDEIYANTLNKISRKRDRTADEDRVLKMFESLKTRLGNFDKALEAHTRLTGTMSPQYIQCVDYMYKGIMARQRGMTG